MKNVMEMIAVAIAVTVTVAILLIMAPIFVVAAGSAKVIRHLW